MLSNLYTLNDSCVQLQHTFLLYAAADACWQIKLLLIATLRFIVFSLSTTIFTLTAFASSSQVAATRDKGRSEKRVYRAQMQRAAKWRHLCGRRSSTEANVQTKRPPLMCARAFAGTEKHWRERNNEIRITRHARATRTFRFSGAHEDTATVATTAAMASAASDSPCKSLSNCQCLP